jgi:hypothetical protein
MNGLKLKPGDQVRITATKDQSGYQPGDKGTVLRGPIIAVDGSGSFYIVTMDKDGAGSWTLFDTEEVEPDV